MRPVRPPGLERPAVARQAIEPGRRGSGPRPRGRRSAEGTSRPTTAIRSSRARPSLTTRPAPSRRARRRFQIHHMAEFVRSRRTESARAAVGRSVSSEVRRTIERVGAERCRPTKPLCQRPSKPCRPRLGPGARGPSSSWRLPASLIGPAGLAWPPTPARDGQPVGSTPCARPVHPAPRPRPKMRRALQGEGAQSGLRAGAVGRGPRGGRRHRRGRPGRVGRTAHDRRGGAAGATAG